MIFKKFQLKATALALSLLALSASSDIFAHCGNNNHERHSERARVRPAQANYQDSTALVPTLDAPIPFSTRNFRTNVEVNDAGSIFEVEVPGLYSLDSYLLVSVPTLGDSVAGYITINDRQLLTFFERETSTDSTLVQFHFNDRLVYLRRGDRVSVVLTEFTPGTAVLARGFVMVALNNSR